MKELKMTDIQTIITDRAKTHGNFKDHAKISQNLKRAIRNEAAFNFLDDPKREALEMILNKVARIIAGNSKHKDHWDDIAGYAMLISKELDL